MAADTPGRDTETEPEAALADALDGVEGTPPCAVCPESADFFLYAAGRVETFACWEHVSPYAALVDGGEAGGAGDADADAAFAERPEALRLD